MNFPHLQFQALTASLMASTLTQVPELSLSDFTNGSASKRSAFVDDLMEGFQYFGFVILKDSW